MTDEQVKYLMMLREFNSELMNLNIKYSEEIERLNNITKEVREFIQERYDGEVLTHTFDKDNVGELLEILGSDKDE